MTSLSLVSLMIVSGTLVPLSATTFLIPTFIRRITSALPSTTISEPLSTSGPAGSFSGPYSMRSMPLREDATSLTTSSVLGDDSTTHFRRISFALVRIAFLFSSRTSSTFSSVILASQGPILSTLSIAAAMIAVETLSRLEGITMDPVVLSRLESRLISIRPILPDFCSSLRSRSGPKSPSVCPKTAPTTSGFSTTP